MFLTYFTHSNIYNKLATNDGFLNKSTFMSHHGKNKENNITSLNMAEKGKDML